MDYDPFQVTALWKNTDEILSAKYLKYIEKPWNLVNK